MNLTLYWSVQPQYATVAKTLHDGGERKPVTRDAGRSACTLIAHYNYTLRFRSCGLSRGAGRCPVPLRTLPENPARAVSPMQPDQRVTLSLETPLMGNTPKNPMRL